MAVGFVASVSAPTAADSSGLDLMPAPIVVEADDLNIDVDDPELIAELEAIHEDFEQGVSHSVPGLTIPVFHRAVVNSGMSVTFDASFPAPSNAQAVILAAATDWDGAVSTTAAAPVEIAVIWKDLGSPSLLGSAGPNGLYAGGSLPTASYYPAPLANTLLGYDINGGSTPELTINLNSTANWYVAGSGSPGVGQIDLYSVVLHEIGHGLGFLGSGSLYNTTPDTVPTLEATPFVFDREVTHNGSPLLETANPDPLLLSNNLYLNVSDSLSERLYAPASWQEGSSFSHLDESTHPAGSPGALMSPSLSSQETARILDAVTLGVMARMGWPMRVGAAKPTIASVSSGSGQASVSWTLDLGQSALAPDGFRVEARIGSSVAGSTSVAGSAGSATVTGLQNGLAYTMAVVPLVDGQAGTEAATSVSLAAVPMLPRAITASGSSLNQTVVWLPPEESTVTSYQVARSTDEGPWVTLGTTAGLSLATTVSEGVHQFRVRGSNEHGFGSWAHSIPIGVGAGVVRPVPLDGQISRLYQAYFLRDPDSAGFSYWRSERAAGLGLSSVSDAFSASAEFGATYGALTDDQFIDLVYQNVLGRPPDATGRAYWLSVLAVGGGRGQVMTGFSESGEFIANTGTAGPQSVSVAEVYRLYVAFFLRIPDDAGLQYWVAVRSGGTPLEVIAAAFTQSAEFQATYGDLPDGDFIELVYNNVLAREPDSAGSQHWASVLATGVDRGSMMIGFSESTEFVLATGTTP